MTTKLNKFLRDFAKQRGEKQEKFKENFEMPMKISNKWMRPSNNKGNRSKKKFRTRDMLSSNFAKNDQLLRSFKSNIRPWNKSYQNSRVTEMVTSIDGNIISYSTNITRCKRTSKKVIDMSQPGRVHVEDIKQIARLKNRRFKFSNKSKSN